MKLYIPDLGEMNLSINGSADHYLNPSSKSIIKAKYTSGK